MLSTVAPLTPKEINEQGILAVLGITISTFLAHTFAGMVNSGWTWADLRRACRDSAPIVTSGVLPALLLASANLGFPAFASLALAELILVTRIALIGVVAARLRNEPASRPTVLVGIGIALVAALIALIKLTITG